MTDVNEFKPFEISLRSLTYLKSAFGITGAKVLRLEITKACADDMKEILILQREAFYEVGVRYKDPETTPLPQTLNELIEESKGQTFLKAVRNGRIIGAVRGRLDGGVCRVSKVMVHPDCRNKGVGRRLMDAIENEFGVNVYELRTGHLDEMTISLYKKLGYVLTGEKERISDTLWFVRMRKEKKRSLDPRCSEDP